MRKIIAALMVLSLCGCTNEKEIVVDPNPLVLNEEEQDDSGMVIISEEGTRESVYRGTVEILNDGKDGKEIIIFVNTGGK